MYFGGPASRAAALEGNDMILPELLLSTSIISLAIFLWTFLQQWKPGDGCSRSSSSSSSMVESGDCGEEDDETGSEAPRRSEDHSQSRRIDDDESSMTGLEDRDTPLSSTPGTPRANTGGVTLSRRQRKNRKRENVNNNNTVVEKNKVKPRISPVLSRKNSDDKNVNIEQTSSSLRTKKRALPSCKQYDKLGAEDSEIYNYFTAYLLSFDQMRQLGFPQDSSLYPGKAYIYRDPEFCHIFPDTSELDDGEYCDNKLDVNAKPFIPTDLVNKIKKVEHYEEYYSDSEGSGDSSDKSSTGAPNSSGRKKSLEDVSGISLNATAKEFVPTFSKTVSVPSLLEGDGDQDNVTHSVTHDECASDSRLVDGRPDNDEVVERRCVRCAKSYQTMSGSGQHILSGDTCSHHWGKLRSMGKEPVYTCCGARAGRQGRGCTSTSQHVWTGIPSQGGIQGPLDGYVKTKHRKSYPANGNFGVYGLDCEMCYTLNGLELTKVTVVGIDGRLVYETLVLPEADIIDYNTRFSGVAAKDLEKGPTKNLKEVQNDLMGFINADTVMVGHGLENDLRALQMIHGVVLDTSSVFPHFYGLPFRRSLRSLVSSYLKREIQVSSWGHDSYEDARACIDLMLWKTRKDNAASSRKLPRQAVKI